MEGILETLGLEHWIHTYGYLAIVVATLVGAEEGVLAGGLLAAGGYLRLEGVIVASALGGSLGDQIYFYLARGFGDRVVNRFAATRRVYPRARRLVHRYGVAVALASRFLAGLRVAVSACCGALKMRPITYSTLNLTSAFLWASTYGLLAYHLGLKLPAWIPDLPGRLAWVLAMALLAALIAARLCFARWKRARILK